METVPSIGATNILEHMIPDSEIVDSVVDILDQLAQNTYHDDFERFMFTQMMRYSILGSVVSDAEQINRFFDNISKVEYFRRRPLFWLQWHMAKADDKKFNDAEKYLQQAYREAENFEKRTARSYNRIQIDDRKAKFLMLRAQHIRRRPDELFRDMKEAWEIVGRLLREKTITHHPFETIKTIGNLYKSPVSPQTQPDSGFSACRLG